MKLQNYMSIFFPIFIFFPSTLMCKLTILHTNAQTFTYKIVVHACTCFQSNVYICVFQTCVIKRCSLLHNHHHDNLPINVLNVDAFQIKIRSTILFFFLSFYINSFLLNKIFVTV